MPDLEVVKVDEDGDEYAVYLNDANLPRLRVSQAYESQGDRSEDAVKFIDEKKKHAEWVIKTIEQRRRTMIKVMEAIVREQNEFFEKGAIALRPLTLQQVASAIGMHESTVSRVTRQKYVQTPRGVFPLKFFFSAGLDNNEGGEVAAKAVKIMIKEIIAVENPGPALVGQEDRGHAAGARTEDRPPHGGQVPRADGNPQRAHAQAVLRPGPQARQEGGRHADGNQHPPLHPR